MKTIKIGTLDKPVSRTGLGTWTIGGGPAWGGDKSRDESTAATQKCPGLRVDFIDTAPGYSFEQSERIMEEAPNGMDREKVTVMTESGIIWTREDALFNRVGDIQLYRDLSKESIPEEVGLSLERLDTGYIDIYMSHQQAMEPYYTPTSQTMELLGELKEKGKIRTIGAANVTATQVKEYIKCSSPDIVQTKYSVLDRAVEGEPLPLRRESEIVFQAYSPLEVGLLSDALPRDYKPVGVQCNRKWFQPDGMPRAMDFLDRLEPMCRKHDCAVTDLAMVWVLVQGSKVTLLSGAITEEQIRKNTGADELELDTEDVVAIRGMAEVLDS